MQPTGNWAAADPGVRVFNPPPFPEYYNSRSVIKLSITHVVVAALHITFGIACIFTVPHWTSLVAFPIWGGVVVSMVLLLFSLASIISDGLYNYKKSRNYSMLRGAFHTLKATSHSTFFDIPMRPVREDQIHRRRLTRERRSATPMMVIIHLNFARCTRPTHKNR